MSDTFDHEADAYDEKLRSEDKYKMTPEYQCLVAMAKKEGVI